MHRLTLKAEDVEPLIDIAEAAGKLELHLCHFTKDEIDRIPGLWDRYQALRVSLDAASSRRGLHRRGKVGTEEAIAELRLANSMLNLWALREAIPPGYDALYFADLVAARKTTPWAKDDNS